MEPATAAIADLVTAITPIDEVEQQQHKPMHGCRAGRNVNKNQLPQRNSDVEAVEMSAEKLLMTSNQRSAHG
ncbi:hypothetical protein AB0C34_31415 [Nocardia sp. NPDC049220]|uniref:hypothetical protein n=1 Tax=Nocardia sp. NPDC049220 TaxID=3155273 RepID=UPI0033D9FF9F